MPDSKQLRRAIRYNLIYRWVKFLIFISNAISRKAWLNFCGMLGFISFYLATNTRRLTRKHLGMAFPEKSKEEIRALTKRTFIMLGKNSGEVLRSTLAKSLDE